MKADVLIIGGGLMGTSIALQLALRGTRSVVLEKDSPGRHASGVNAGGLRQLNRDPVEVPLSVAASGMWRRIRELVDSDCDVKLGGQLRVAENTADLHQLEQRAAAIRAMGYRHEEIIGREELYRLVPDLAPHCVGALLSRGDGFARPFHTTTAFRRKAQALGVKFCTGRRVDAVARHGDVWEVAAGRETFQAPALVNCAGAWADTIAAAVGDPVPMKTGAPMMMVTERLPHFLDPVVGAVSRKLSFKQMQNGTVLIGGAHLARHDMQTETTRIDFRQLAVSSRTVIDLFPRMREVQIVRCWAGLEAFMPDHIPVIGPSVRAPAAWHAFGFSAHGFQLAPVVGLIVSQLILDGRTELPIEAFRIDRFG
jgi:sarcosine oxidase subunit beta